jgi:tetratricopeptide (TPR) repeat protein
MLIGLVLVSYGTLQILGRDFVAWNNPHNSMIGTVGNPNFASSLIAILVLLAMFTFFHKDIHLGYKLASLSVVFLGFFSIYRSNSRQGLLVIGLGLLLFASLYSWFQSKRFKYLVPTASLILIIVSVLGMLQKGPAAYFLYKDSVSVRGFYWGAAIEMFKNFPLTGVGLDSYGSYFKEFRSPDYPLRYGYELTSTNAHNTYLQLFSTGGIFVGVSYCLLMLFILLVGLKNIRETNGVERNLAIALLSIWISFQSQSFISIDNMGISIWGWILGGAIIGLRNNRIRGVLDSKKKTGPKSINLTQVFISTLFLIPILIISILLHRQEADLFVAKSALIQSPINQELALSNAQKVLDNNLADPSYKFEAALIYFELGKTQVGEAQVKELSENDPRNLIFLDWLVKNEIRKNDYAAALNLAQKIERYDPWNVRNIFLIGELHKLLGNFTEMEKIRLKVNAMAPNTELSIKANQILV